MEWTRAEQEGWLIQQAYEGMLRAVEEDRDGRRHVIQGKMAIAELAETATGRICRVLGGGTFSRASPFGHWHEDMRALGFLRPPWALAYDQLYAMSVAGIVHIPSLLVVTACALHNGLEIATRYPHGVSSASET